MPSITHPDFGKVPPRTRTPRPTYETEADRSREEQVAEYLESRWGLARRKLPIKDRFDYAFLDKSRHIDRYVEIKCRSHNIGKYPTIMLSSSKVLTAKAVSFFLGIPCYLVVRFGDGTIHSVIMSAGGHLPPEIGGRFDRGDPQDVEPVVHYPVNLLELV
jgi:hypothetical protein